MNHFVHCCSCSTSNKITSKGCQSASQTCDFDAKNAKFFCGGAHPPLQTPPPVGRGAPPPHTPLPRRLDLNPSHSEILCTLLDGVGDKVSAWHRAFGSYKPYLVDWHTGLLWMWRGHSGDYSQALKVGYSQRHDELAKKFDISHVCYVDS